MIFKATRASKQGHGADGDVGQSPNGEKHILIK